MRRILFLLTMALMSQVVRSQIVGYQGHVDEYDIQGRWSVTSLEGSLIQMDGEFEYISFSGNQAGRFFMKKGEDNFFVLWFISNNNKLHIQLNDGHVLNFVIVDYQKGEKDYMKLKSFDDACTIELKMDWPVNHVNTQRLSENIPSTKYNLQGLKVEDSEGVYIQNGRKIIAK